MSSCPVCHGAVTHNFNGRATRDMSPIVDDVVRARRYADELTDMKSRAWGYYASRDLLSVETLEAMRTGLLRVVDTTQDVLEGAERCPHCDGLATEAFDREGNKLGFMRRRSPLAGAEAVAEAVMALIEIPVERSSLDLEEIEHRWQGKTGLVWVEETEELYSYETMSAFNPHLLAALELNNLYWVVKSCLEAVGYGTSANVPLQNFDRAAKRELSVPAI